MKRRAFVSVMTVAMLLPGAPMAASVILAAAAAAQPVPAARKSASPGGSLLPGASSKDPVNIDAGKLDYFDKEQKLVYTGDVVAKQGDSTLHASVLTIFLSRDPKKAGDGTEEAAPAVDATAKTAGNSVRRMEAKGPVTIVSKDQVGTGDNGSYDKAENKITLVGNVTLTQATNIIKGDKLVYDMDTGQAQVSSGQTQGRVKSVFTPGSGTPGTPGPKRAKHAAPATAAPTASK